MGAQEQSIAKQALQAGNPIPDRIANAPELLPGLQLYLQAFFDLDSERSHGSGLTAIPWSSVANYSFAYDFDDEQTEALFYFIKIMDTEHLKKLDAKEKAKAKAPPKRR